MKPGTPSVINLPAEFTKTRFSRYPQGSTGPGLTMRQWYFDGTFSRCLKLLFWRSGQYVGCYEVPYADQKNPPDYWVDVEEEAPAGVPIVDFTHMEPVIEPDPP